MNTKIQHYIDLMDREMCLRNYSPKTRKSYQLCVKDYFSSCGCGPKCSCDPCVCNMERVKKYLLKKQGTGATSQTTNLHLSAIKFFYREIVKKPEKIDIKLAKRSGKLPVVLSRGEVEKIIGSISNAKHRLMVSLAYGAGLGVSEIISLKTGDINTDELTLHIKNAKGKKDRITIFPKKIRDDLRNIAAGKKKDEYVFMSNRGGKMTERSVQKMFAAALKKSNIKKPATFHSLRHSFAAHLLENGVDIRYVQELLGHANIRTTQIYAKVTNPIIKNIKSPL